jgi:hypothetical protein
MTIHFFCPRWGSEDFRWDDFCARVKSAGYDGVEYAIAAATGDRELDRAWNAAEKHRLLLIPQHYDTVTADFSAHLDQYHAWLDRIKAYPAVEINSQTGKDFFPFHQNQQLIELGNRYGVLHETHRGKFSFAAHITKTYLEAIPELRLTLDVSHWINVSESFLDDQGSAMELAIDRTDHIHARAGYPEGPQVSDPRAPEWKEALERHLAWWDQVVAHKRTVRETITITPEFGPFPYMVHLPGTGEPIADQWEVNRFMMELLRKRYN